MTERLCTRPRRRSSLSLSQPPPSSSPVEELDHALDIVHRIIRTLPNTTVEHEELIALAGILTQLNGALVALTDQLIPAAHRCERSRVASCLPRAGRQTPTRLLLECRSSYLAAATAARAVHAELKR